MEFCFADWKQDRAVPHIDKENGSVGGGKMKVSYGAAVIVRAAYKSGVINFATYCAVKKKYGIGGALPEVWPWLLGEKGK